MKTRVENLIGEQARGCNYFYIPFILCQNVKKEIHQTSLYSSQYSIFDDKDSKI